MQYFPYLKTLKRLHAFLGITSYYMKFAKNYGKIVAPITSLLKNDTFVWSKEAAHKFTTLKEAMCTTLVLVVHDLNKAFVFECNASCIGIQTVLMQG